MQSDILDTLHYFAQFQYPPTVDELWTFSKRKTSLSMINDTLDSLVRKGKLIVQDRRVYLPDSAQEVWQRRYIHSNMLMARAQKYLRPLQFIRTIQLLGISGSLSMRNADIRSDIDVFIVTTSHNLWTTRALVLIYKKILTILKPEIGRNLCFNLFFSVSGLELSQQKHTEYIGHEILQLKVVFERDSVYDQLIHANNWITDFFPNVQIKSREKKDNKSLSQKAKKPLFFEKICEKVQKWWLRRKKYRWADTRGQLWLIQDDFEEKLKAGQ